MALDDDAAIELHSLDKKRKPKNHPIQILSLLTEIIVEILLRLPVKSLLQFRSVCKSWRSIISDPKFVKAHLNISSKNAENAHHRLIFSLNKYREKTIKMCHLSPVLYITSVNPITDLDYPMKHEQNRFVYVSIVGSIHGLVLICIDKLDLFLWNPSTRISKRLPHSGITLDPMFLTVQYGFDYDECTDDYKVVGVFGILDTSFRRVYQLMVYSLRTNCWREIGFLPSDYMAMFWTSFNFVNGAIHWAAYSKRNIDLKIPPVMSVVSLDLVKETYSEVPQPNYGEGESGLRFNVLEQCLFILSDCGQNCVNVWMMKEFGVRESWTKLATFSNLFGPNHYEYPVLLYMTKKGELLYRSGSCILLCDPKSKNFSVSDIDNFDPCHGAHIYIESLVSPLIHEDQECQQ